MRLWGEKNRNWKWDTEDVHTSAPLHTEHLFQKNVFVVFPRHLVCVPNLLNFAIFHFKVKAYYFIEFHSSSSFQLMFMEIFPNNFTEIKTNFLEKLSASPGYLQRFENNWVTGFPNYQLFRRIDNWGWGFRPGVAGVIRTEQTSAAAFSRSRSKCQLSSADTSVLHVFAVEVYFLPKR